MHPTAWADPVEVASAFADEPYACVLLSDADGWSYVLRDPDVVVNDPTDLSEPAAMAGTGEAAPHGPPFQGGVVGLASY